MSDALMPVCAGAIPGVEFVLRIRRIQRSRCFGASGLFGDIGVKVR
jgi:hypothetical protein